MKPDAPKDLMTGNIHQSNQFGHFEIVSYINYRNIYIQFLGTGFIKKTTGKHVRTGSIRDPFSPSVFGVGFTGTGKYESRIAGEKSQSYQTWSGMLERCYSTDYHKRFPTYIGCTVRADWHNYQNFASWFDDHYIDGYQLDKDIKIDGNKQYSEDTCMFVTQRENSQKANSKSYVMISPDGETFEIYNLSEFCRTRGLQQSKMVAVSKGRRSHHKGWTKHKR